MNWHFFLLCGIVILFSCKSKTETLVQSDKKKKIDLTVQTIDSIKIEGTKWVYVLSEDCQDYILFKINNHFEQYSCEAQDTIFGIYQIENDIIILHQQKSAYDDDFPIDSEHRFRQSRCKYKIDKNRILLMEIWKLNIFDKWEQLPYDNSIDSCFFSRSS